MTPASSQPPRQRGGLNPDRARQARAWMIALDPVYGIVAFGLVGYLIDRWQGTAPRWMGILAIVGLVAGFYRFVREAARLNRDNTRQWEGRPFRPVEPEADPDLDPDLQARRPGDQEGQI